MNSKGPVAVFLALALFRQTACNPAMFSGLSAGDGGSSKTKSEPGKSTPEARAGMMKVYETNLEQCNAKTAEMEKKLAEAIEKLSGSGKSMTGQPLTPLGESVVKLRKEKVTLTIDVMGSPEAPMLMVKDSLMEEGQKMQGQPPAKMQAYAKRMQALTPLTGSVRDQIMGVNAALGSGFGAAMSCNQYAMAFTTTLGAMSNGGEEPTDEMFALYAKYLQANARSKSVVAASIALVSVVQAGLAGKDVKGVETLLDGVKKMKDATETVSNDQAKQAYKAAGQALVDACREQQEKVYRDRPELQRPAVDPCSKEGSRMRGSPSEERARAAEKGGGGGDVDPSLRRLIPSNSPLGDAADALAAIKKGDFLGALKGAAKLAGNVTPFGGVVSNVLGMFGLSGCSRGWRSIPLEPGALRDERLPGHAVAVKPHVGAVLHDGLALLDHVEGRLVVGIGRPRARPQREDLPVVGLLAVRPADLHGLLRVDGQLRDARDEGSVAPDDLFLVAGAIVPVHLDVAGERGALVVGADHGDAPDLRRGRVVDVLGLARDRERRGRQRQGQKRGPAHSSVPAIIAMIVAGGTIRRPQRNTVSVCSSSKTNHAHVASMLRINDT